MDLKNIKFLVIPLLVCCYSFVGMVEDGYAAEKVEVKLAETKGLATHAVTNKVTLNSSNTYKSGSGSHPYVLYLGGKTGVGPSKIYNYKQGLKVDVKIAATSKAEFMSKVPLSFAFIVEISIYSMSFFSGKKYTLVCIINNIYSFIF